MTKQNTVDKTKKMFDGNTPRIISYFGQIEYGLNLNKRIVYIEDTIDIYTAGFLEQRLNLIVDETGDKKTPITLKISSYGGDVYGMFSTVDIIKNYPVKINTYGTGPVMSAAAFILSAGTNERVLTQNSVLMIHMMSTWFGGTTSDVLSEAKHAKDLQDKLYNFLEKHSNKDIRFWERNSRVNMYLPADKCLEFGLIDKIV